MTLGTEMPFATGWCASLGFGKLNYIAISWSDPATLLTRNVAIPALMLLCDRNSFKVNEAEPKMVSRRATNTPYFNNFNNKSRVISMVNLLSLDDFEIN